MLILWTTFTLYIILSPFALTHVVSLSDPLDGVGPPGEALDSTLQPRDLTLAHQQPPRDLHKPEEVGDEKWGETNK